MSVPVALAAVWGLAGLSALVIAVRAFVVALNRTDLLCDEIDTTPIFLGADLDPADDEVDEFSELDLEWLSMHRIGDR